MSEHGSHRMDGNSLQAIREEMASGMIGLRQNRIMAVFGDRPTRALTARDVLNVLVAEDGLPPDMNGVRPRIHELVKCGRLLKDPANRRDPETGKRVSCFRLYQAPAVQMGLL